ncbi:uncharacterized protein K02A2.6-like isoform X1 [Culex pipiens pallens]|uniref:uncharacterized protein K02A2.6-like isoform X1 n=1 Tax=Culex pipiens pallens TaxID=42434 RepID=UPI0022AAB49D|nr:uncharacterized protein K02A2.6-like isoform X1 [Culex pipiens pallens]
MSQGGMVSSIEPFRKGSSFSDWICRLKYTFDDLAKPGTSSEKQLTDMMGRLTTAGDMAGSDSDDSYSEWNSGELQCMCVESINKISEPCLMNVKLDDILVSMEVDCGSTVTVMGKSQYFTLFDKPLKQCDKQLLVVNGNKLEIEGETDVLVELNGSRHVLKLLILNSNFKFIPLFGRNWMDIFFSQWRQFFSSNLIVDEQVNSLTTPKREELIEEIKNDYGEVFIKDFSTPIKGFEAELVLRSDVPIFKKAYDVPYRLREKVLIYLDRLEKQNVITPVKSSDWASPVIVVMKKDNQIRLVIDCRVSINKVLVPNSYPLPVACDLFAKLANCKVFCCLDLEGAYTQLALSERSRKFMVINTIKGLFTYNRLPQGASPSASIFQFVMDQILGGIENVFCYLDDVLIAGENVDDCRQKLLIVLDRLAKANIKVNWEKCKFFVPELNYLGHIIGEKGLMTSPDKISTIQKAKVPTNVHELKSYLGLINYYNRFVPNLSSKLYHLYNLLRKNVKFVWSHDCDTAFQESKQSLIKANILEFYDPHKEIVVVSDASGYGLGGVIAHVIDKVEKPISFTSFSLDDAQKKYPILHLEALALVCTIKKFHKYLFGQEFIAYTDHKPLLGIFGKEGKNSIFVTRLQRYILELSIYKFELRYRPSAKMGNADFCSRFPLEQAVPAELDQDFVRSINFSNTLPIDYVMVAKVTKDDVYLQQIINYLRDGWPLKFDKRLMDVFANQKDLEVVEGCVLYQDRVVIPRLMQSGILTLLHANHAGIVKMKHVYWFGINKDIESFVSTCDVCASMAVVPKPKILSQWTPTTRPFSRIHIDFFHFSHSNFLLIVDSNTKWLEIEWMKKGTDCAKVLQKLVAYFARFGLPDVLVSDGGPPFNSHAFVSFLEKQGIKVLKSPPYNPSSNGQAERLVRTAKDVLKKFLLEPAMAEIDLENQISLFLMNYRNNVVSSTGQLPAEKVFNYKPKTLLDLLNPKNNYKQHLLKQQSSPDENLDDCLRDVEVSNDFLKDLIPGDVVWYKNHNAHIPNKWIRAHFLKQFSKNLFQVSVGSARVMAHKMQLKPHHERKERPNVHLFPVVHGEYEGEEEAVCTAAADISSEEEFRGFPVMAGGKRRKRSALTAELPEEYPRRSKRLRKPIHDLNYQYN